MNDDASIHYHRIIHQQSLCAKTVGFELVMDVVIKVVSYIRSHGFKKAQFQDFLTDMNTHYMDITYFCDVLR